MARRAVVADRPGRRPAGGTRSSGRWCRCCPRSGCGSRRTTSPRTAPHRGTGRWPRSSGPLGLGLDLRRQAPASLRAIHRWLRLYKELRPLLHGGQTVRLDQTSPASRRTAWWPTQAARRCSRWSGWTGRRPGSGWTVWTRRPTYRLEVVGTRSADPQAVTLAWSADGPSPADAGRVLEHGGDRAAAGPAGVGAVAAPGQQRISPDDDDRALSLVDRARSASYACDRVASGRERGPRPRPARRRPPRRSSV